MHSVGNRTQLWWVSDFARVVRSACLPEQSSVAQLLWSLGTHCIQCPTGASSQSSHTSTACSCPRFVLFGLFALFLFLRFCRGRCCCDLIRIRTDPAFYWHLRPSHLGHLSHSSPLSRLSRLSLLIKTSAFIKVVGTPFAVAPQHN